MQGETGSGIAPGHMDLKHQAVASPGRCTGHAVISPNAPHAVQLADFGLSRVLEAHATHVSTKTYGTLAYMPGENFLPQPAALHCRSSCLKQLRKPVLSCWHFPSQTVYCTDVALPKNK